MNEATPQMLDTRHTMRARAARMLANLPEEYGLVLPSQPETFAHTELSLTAPQASITTLAVRHSIWLSDAFSYPWSQDPVQRCSLKQCYTPMYHK